MLSSRITSVKFIMTVITSISLILANSIIYANIDNPTPLIILHGGPESNTKQLVPELQPFEDYHDIQSNSLEQDSNQPDDNIFKFTEIIAHLDEITKNYKNKYEIFTHSIGGIILFEYIKSIANKSSTRDLPATPPTQQAKSSGPQK